MWQSLQQQAKASIQTQQKFVLFKEWFQKNGGLSRDISFPVRFEPGGYLGICANTQIGPNTVILAVPKTLAVSVSRARQSQLKEVYPLYEIFTDEDNDDADYNVLCLFLIMEKMKHQESFFWPYIQLLDSSETVTNWTNTQIEHIHDPYINIKFIDSIRATFQPIYETFQKIAKKNPKLFPEQLTRQIFDEMYATVMTRGFGWGLPETMLVPYADFLNHSSTGVNHYVFDKFLENSKQSSSYIKKKHELNLSLFPSFPNQILPISYEPNLRQVYVQKNTSKLKQMGLISLNSSPETRMDPTITNPLYNMLIESVIEDGFDEQVYLSTDSEDNDSDSEAEGLEESEEIEGQIKGQPVANKLGTVLMARKYLRFAFRQIDKDMDQRFTEPKPNVNAEFEEGVKFQWWFQDNHELKSQQQHQNKQIILQEQEQLNIKSLQTEEQMADKYFIVSSSRKIHSNQQIFNCYGRRSNRFLLIWYGFCFQHNKYDSVPFRVWSPEVTKRTGHTIYTRFLTQTEYREGIPIGNERFNAYMLSEEFRLKTRRVDHKLMAYLRYRFLIANRLYKELYKAKEWHVNRVTAVHMEIECWLEYQRHLNTLAGVFGIDLWQDKDKGREQKAQQQKLLGAREYFKSILQRNNQQIILKNTLAVNEILKVLYEIQTHLQKQQRLQSNMNQTSKNSQQQNKIKWLILPKQLLVNLYKTAFTDNQNQHPLLYKRLDQVSGRSRSTLRKQLKMMVREYLRILSKSEVRRTMYTEFE